MKSLGVRNVSVFPDLVTGEVMLPCIAGLFALRAVFASYQINPGTGALGKVGILKATFGGVSTIFKLESSSSVASDSVELSYIQGGGYYSPNQGLLTNRKRECIGLPEDLILDSRFIITFQITNYETPGDVIDPLQFLVEDFVYEEFDES